MGNMKKHKNKKNIMKEKNNYNENIEQLLKKVNEIESVKNKANEIFKQKKYEEAIEEYTKAFEFVSSNKKFNFLILAKRALCYRSPSRLKSKYKTKSLLCTRLCEKRKCLYGIKDV